MGKGSGGLGWDNDNSECASDLKYTGHTCILRRCVALGNILTSLNLFP